MSEGSATLPNMMTTTTHTDLPIPTGATTVDDWEGGGRLFTGSTMKTIEASGTLRDDVCVYTGGLQHDDGTYSWEVVAGNLHADHPLTAAQARQIGEALIAAADELDAIAGAVTR
ncbi:hypothetical protein DQP56_10640 [Mycolicibacter senuensis]|nr:hypothetical protein DQP56_10640 [Mycolicibacter senuensis]